MRQLLYVSRSVNKMTVGALIDLLNSAREHNEARNVTGLLFYESGSFLQLLEGAPTDVDKIFERVKADKRHEAIWVLADDNTASERLCANWRMGFYHLSSLEAVAGPGLIGNDHSELVALLRNAAAGGLAARVLRSFLQRNLIAFVT